MRLTLGGLIVLVALIFLIDYANAETCGPDSASYPASYEFYPNSGLFNKFWTHRECEQHYFNCALNSWQLTTSCDCSKAFEPQPEPPKEENVLEKIGCDDTIDFSDGPGSALWKPSSDNTRQPVFLLHEWYCGNVEKVEVFSSDGEKELNGRPRIDGISRACGPNSNRLHYDVPRSASELDKVAPIYIKLHFVGGGHECRIVEKPSQRYD